MPKSKNMFNRFISDDKTKQGDNVPDTATLPLVHDTEHSSHSIDQRSDQPSQKTILPWDEDNSLSEYSQKLHDAGYDSVRLLATASKEEIHILTGISEEFAELIINKAKKWCDFDFQSAATILNDRSQLIHIPTGSKSLDKILGGGIEPQSITEFYGAFATGKTQLCIQLAVNTVLELNGDVIYIDTEGSFRPERVMQICKGKNIDPNRVLERIFVGRAHNTDIQIQLTNNVIQLAKNKNIRLLICDSLTSTFRAEYVGKGALLDRQQKLNQHMRQLSRIADMLNLAVVVTNQVMSVINSFENTVVPIGGNILAHSVTHRIHFTKSSKKPAVRHAKIVASPSLPDANAAFKITETGIKDVNASNFHF